MYIKNDDNVDKKLLDSDNEPASIASADVSSTKKRKFFIKRKTQEIPKKFKKLESKKLFEFQIEKLRDMITCDTEFVNYVLDKLNVLIKPRFAHLKTNVGNGKTIVTLYRIFFWLGYKLNHTNCNELLKMYEDDFVTSKSSSKHDNSTEYTKLFEEYLIKENGMRESMKSHDNKYVSVNTGYRDYNPNANKILLLVPFKLAQQWKYEINSVIPSEYVKKYFFFIHTLNHNALIRDDDSIQIFVTTFKSKEVIMHWHIIESLHNLFYDHIYIDEAHLYYRDFSDYLIENIFNVNFLWLISATFNEELDNWIKSNHNYNLMSILHSSELFKYAECVAKLQLQCIDHIKCITGSTFDTEEKVVLQKDFCSKKLMLQKDFCSKKLMLHSEEIDLNNEVIHNNPKHGDNWQLYNSVTSRENKNKKTNPNPLMNTTPAPSTNISNFLTTSKTTCDTVFTPNTIYDSIVAIHPGYNSPGDIAAGMIYNMVLSSIMKANLSLGDLPFKYVVYGDEMNNLLPGFLKIAIKHKTSYFSKILKDIDLDLIDISNKQLIKLSIRRYKEILFSEYMNLSNPPLTAKQLNAIRSLLNLVVNEAENESKDNENSVDDYEKDVILKDCGFEENFSNVIREKIMERKKELTERLANSCNICLLDDNKKILMSCCNQVLCNLCIESWSKKFFESQSVCPYCRAGMKDMLENISKDSSQDFGNKLYEFRKLCTNIFSFDTTSKTAIVYSLSKQSLSEMFSRLPFNYLIIDGIISAKIAKFRSDPSIRFCFINSQLCNYGFNMSFVDNVIILNELSLYEHQMIGRFQRYPRNTQLKIYYFEEF